MNDNSSITNADERRLIELIVAAVRRVVYMAPGITHGIATALAEAWARLGRDAVTVILDVDPDVCRLGYGTIEGLTEVQNAAVNSGALICHQPGVRIGLLICDDATLVYSPTPLLVEADSTTLRRPNAVLFGAPPAQLSREVGLGENPDRERSIGLDPVQPAKITEVEDDIASNPPVKFDLARRVRVFTSQFQFVELEMTGCYISRKKAPIPSSLVGLANAPSVQSQFHAQFSLVNNVALKVKVGERELTEKSLLDKRRKIENDFLVSLKGYGSVVRRSRKETLIEAVEDLRSDVTAFQRGVLRELQKQMDQSAEVLVAALLPAVQRNPPSAYTKIHGPRIDDETLRALLKRDIEHAFGRADDLVGQMMVRLVFKDLAYESLVDPDFLAVARKAMPDLKFLHEEFDAAKAKGR